MAGTYRKTVLRCAVALTLLAQIGLMAAQLGSMLLDRHLWLADLANFIRPHLLLASFALFLAGALLRRRSTQLAGIAMMLAALWPYLWLPAPAEPAPGRPLTLVSANLLIDNFAVNRFVAVPEIASADILVMQEVRRKWQVDLGATGKWPYESSQDLRANSDMKVFSRFPILSEQKIPALNGDTGGRHALRLELQVDDQRVTLYALHPQTPRSPRKWRERSAYLADVMSAVGDEPADQPVILAGDWNTPSWSPFMRDFLDATGFRTTESRWWPAPTRFSVRFGGITQLGTPIDRVVVSPHLGLLDLTIGPDFGSNHLPVIVRLTLPN